MTPIAILLRLMQLYTHNAHNLVKGPVFMPDHSMLGDLYPTYESAYDDLIERLIGKGEMPDLVAIQEQAVIQLKAKPAQVPENKVYFEQILMMEKQLCQSIETYIVANKCSEGTKQMLGDMCDKSEMRQYKLSRRIK
jgi:DNA-binding ferritin-like protein